MEYMQIKKSPGCAKRLHACPGLRRFSAFPPGPYWPWCYRFLLLFSFLFRRRVQRRQNTADPFRRIP